MPRGRRPACAQSAARLSHTSTRPRLPPATSPPSSVLRTRGARQGPQRIQLRGSVPSLKLPSTTGSSGALLCPSGRYALARYAPAQRSLACCSLVPFVLLRGMLLHWNVIALPCISALCQWQDATDESRGMCHFKCLLILSLLPPRLSFAQRMVDMPLLLGRMGQELLEPANALSLLHNVRFGVCVSGHLSPQVRSSLLGLQQQIGPLLYHTHSSVNALKSGPLCLH